MTPEALIALGFTPDPRPNSFSKYAHGFMLSVALQPNEQIYVRLRIGDKSFTATGSCYSHLREALKLQMKDYLLNALEKLETLK